MPHARIFAFPHLMHLPYVHVHVVKPYLNSLSFERDGPASALARRELLQLITCLVATSLPRRPRCAG